MEEKRLTTGNEIFINIRNYSNFFSMICLLFFRFVYPTEVNMKKYLVKEVEEEYNEGSYTYRLVGVVVHRGGADAGHYYSFIQDRTSSSWNKFDDKTVDAFSLHVRRVEERRVESEE